MPKSIVSFNSFGCQKVGEFKIALKGYFKNLKYQGNEIILFEKNKSSNQFSINDVYDNLVFAIIENFPLVNFLQSQQKFFDQHNIALTNIDALSEEADTDNSKQVTTYRATVKTDS